MPYFPDFSPYAGSILCLPGTVNIGWLDELHAFPVWTTGPEFRHRLQQLCQSAICNRTAGFQMCPLCKNGVCGNGEVHLVGRNGAIFAAPQMIAHYVTVHQYCPPLEFIAAVFRGRFVPQIEPTDEHMARALLHKAQTPVTDPAAAVAALQRIIERYRSTKVVDEAEMLLATLSDATDQKSTTADNSACTNPKR